MAGADLAVIWPMIMSGPGSWPRLMVTGELWDDNDVAFVGCILAGAFLNAVAINGVIAQIRRAQASYDVDDTAAG